MEIVIIGTGNTATTLGKLFKKHGHQILEVVGRSSAHTNNLAELLGARPEYEVENMTQQAGLYLIAVSDVAIDVISQDIHLQDKLVVHAAGSVSKDVLRHSSNKYGVLYPIQSMRKEIEELPEIPLLIDANNETAKKELLKFAQTISTHVQYADDLLRKKVHLAAVFVSNFPNYLYALTEEFCLEEKISFDLLLPLIHETTNRLNAHPAGTTLTGPAVREDFTTIDTHLRMLQDFPLMKTIYLAITQSIISWRQNENL